MSQTSRYGAQKTMTHLVVPMVTIGLFAFTTTSCSNVEFGAGAPKRPSGGSQTPNNEEAQRREEPQPLTPYGTPESPSLPQPGWVVDASQSQLEKLLTSLGDTANADGDPSDTDNGSGSDQDTGISANSDGVLWLPCKEGETSAGQFPADFFGYEGTTVQVSGEFCPSASLTGDIRILFVIDHSGSMEGSSSEGPNDKTMQGSCGRLRAADALMKKYQSMADANVSAGVVGFSDQARVQLPMADLTSLQANLTPTVFCGSDSNFARTNYEAALNVAYSQLASLTGTKIVYFISDGSPTTGGSDPRQAGLAAAQQLRSIPDLSLYALFVGYQAGSANNPQGYLEQLAGDASHVRVTANADELAQAATTIGQSEITIDAANVAANLDVKGQISAVALERFGTRPDMKNRYIWLTKPFELSGDPQDPVLNELTVSAKASDGSEMSSVAKILFHQFKP